MASLSMEASQQLSHEPPPNLPLVAIHRRAYRASFLPMLRARYRLLDPLEDPNGSNSDLNERVRIMLCVGPTRLTAEEMARYPSLECIVGTSAGFDHLDIAECRRRGIRVATAGESFSDDVADYAIGLLIDVLRRISAADRFVRAGSWPVKGEFPLGSKVSGKRVGIIGLGSIGLRISKRLVAFGCTIAYNSRKRKHDVPFPFYANVRDLAVDSDILILSCALTEDTHRIINKDVMTALGKEGVIINIGRGALIDEKELVRFLVQGEIGGAGLDVYEDHPNVPKELYALDNVVLSAHRAVMTSGSIDAVVDLAFSNLEAFFANKPLVAQVELE